jgi:phage tail sheath protein FI
MPATFTYPGIYVEEVPSGVHPIVGASTSDTAFVDYFPRGPMGVATRVTSAEEFERVFGGHDAQSEGSYAVRLYFQNGGQIAWIVRVSPVADPPVATLTLKDDQGDDALVVAAANAGAWGSNLQVAAVAPVPPDPEVFNLFVREAVPDGGGGTLITASEVHRGLGMTAGSANYAPDVVNATSTLVRLSAIAGAKVPDPEDTETGDPPDDAWQQLPAVADATPIDADGQPVDAFNDALVDGLSALDRIEPFRFNLLCLPATAVLKPADAKATVDVAAAYARDKRAFLLVDPPPLVTTAVDIQVWLLGADGPAPTPNAAVYFPRLTVADPLAAGRPREVGPSGAMAGIYARTDATRGTWKAPAGIDAILSGAIPAVKLNDADSGRLNPIAINALRTFPVIGNVAWGARTLFGADQRGSEWKYVPVRRMALLIENSLVGGLGWVVFEPNDEPLWAQIRLNVGAFMQDLFRQAAFQGATPREAYLVKCDRTTTTQSDIDKGIVNILVGFAPLKPAEFVVIRIQQLAGQTQS